MSKVAFITGITGQDGAYLAKLLLDRNYEVHGLIRRNSSANCERLDGIQGKLHFHYGDLADGQTISRALEAVVPDEIYNLASQSQVKVSFENPVYTGDVTGNGTVRLLEAVRQLKLPAKIYQAGSSEMFGASAPPQNEHTPFRPRSIYACAKVFAHHAAVHYREAYGMFVCNGILFNHESEMRGENFVTRKITKAVAAIKHGKQDKLELGTLAPRRDWGHAEDYVMAMWMMMQEDKPDDYVIATGVSHSVCDFAEAAFKCAGLDWGEHVRTGKTEFLRPIDAPHLFGDASKARLKLGWFPKITFQELVERMVRHDLAAYDGHA